MKNTSLKWYFDRKKMFALGPNKYFYLQWRNLSKNMFLWFIQFFSISVYVDILLVNRYQHIYNVQKNYNISKLFLNSSSIIGKIYFSDNLLIALYIRISSIMRNATLPDLCNRKTCMHFNALHKVSCVRIPV